MLFQVGQSPDLARISALPEAAPPEHDLVQVLSEYLRTPTGTMTLFPVQARAIEYVHDHRGALIMAPVGAGKTLMSFLFGTVLGSVRPLLIVPANLREKTFAEMEQLRHHWRITIPQVVSYTELSLETRAEFFQQHQPDLIICDEAHFLRNHKAAVTRRLKRYKEERGAGVVFVALTGTPVKRSLADCAHLGEWALGDGSPFPHKWAVLKEWRLATDEGVPERRRIAPGQLKLLYTEEDKKTAALGDSLQAARNAVARRIQRTPGIVTSLHSFEETALTIRAVDPGLDSVVQDYLSNAREEWIAPDGHDLLDFTEQHRIGLSLACGFYYRWDPPAPDEWKLARSKWGRCVREIIASEDSFLDTDFQISKALDAGSFEFTTEDGDDASNLLLRWRGIKDTFTPNPVPTWISDRALTYAKTWTRLHPTGIVWTPYIAFGQRLAEETGLSYFAQDGKDWKRGTPIEKAPPGRPIICSVASNKQGRNLQAWNRNLIVAPSSSGETWEQLIGRTHRTGQTNDVTVDVFFSTPEQKKAWSKALADARYQETLTGQEQKLTGSVTKLIDLPND